jgi:hypothetical protein
MQMRKLSLACVVLSVLALHPVSVAGQKPSKLTPVPLNVTVHSVVDGNPCQICGDGYELSGTDTIYRHGQDGVEAVFDGFGNLILNFQTNVTRIRFLQYDYGTMPPDGLVGLGSRHYLATIDDTEGDGPLQSLDGSQNVRSCPSYYDDRGVQYRHAFQRNCGGDADGTSYLVVTRIDNDTWTLEGEGASVADVFHLSARGKTAYVPDGDYALRFKMTLARQ